MRRLGGWDQYSWGSMVLCEGEGWEGSSSMPHREAWWESAAAAVGEVGFCFRALKSKDGEVGEMLGLRREEPRGWVREEVRSVIGMPA